MKSKYLLFSVFGLFFLGVLSVNAAEEAVQNAQVKDGSLKMGYVKEGSIVESVAIQGTANAGMSNDAMKATSALKAEKPLTHSVSIADNSNKSKKTFQLSHKKSKTASRKTTIVGAQSSGPKAKIKQSKELRDLETKRKNRRESLKRSLRSRQSRHLLKVNPDEKENAP